MVEKKKKKHHVFAAPSRRSDGSSGPVLAHVVWKCVAGTSSVRNKSEGAALMTGRRKADGSRCARLTAAVELEDSEAECFPIGNWIFTNWDLFYCFFHQNTFQHDRSQLKKSNAVTSACAVFVSAIHSHW